ncbi:T-cell immunoglobulin and mucin domain-containing protein 4-like isoform X2 [Entelurus aequoreus]|uniref:T-cell immunoglobulin and mucin domain-containing protein 4-like isoform X2 n=1 Tax=Entelurus aequoreus TaxID=161455 RepID=UPI002B1D97EA|nr:T-cell immunoglobulin and mucin domain-containing protein 4-like isoform X2 [Entelurus aequoreus]
MAGRLKLLLMIFVPAVCGSFKLFGHTGQNITLPCKYNIKTHKQTPACWGLGPIPVSGCRDMIISTNGLKVQGETNRYKLLGPLSGGDVSLTILNVTKRDSGIYGCRVEIPGWWNDEKHSIQLVVTEAPQMTSTTLKTKMSAEKMAAGITAVNVIATETSFFYNSTETLYFHTSTQTNVPVILFGVVIVVLVTAVAIGIVAFVGSN